MLIKLTGVPHPDLNGGVAQPVYIDASRVLLICQSHHQYPKIGAVEKSQKLHNELYRAACELRDKVWGYSPGMTDPVAVGWMHEARTASEIVTTAHRAWGEAASQPEYHPRVDCTEVQLACGTALEHGVMLTRVWVTESPDKVAEMIAPYWWAKADVRP